jgi:ATP-dependent Lon protease
MSNIDSSMHTRSKNIKKDAFTQTSWSVHPDEPLFINKRKVVAIEDNDEYIITNASTEHKSKKNKSVYVHDSDNDTYADEYDDDPDFMLDENDFLQEVDDDEENEDYYNQSNVVYKCDAHHKQQPQEAIHDIYGTTGKTILIPFSVNIGKDAHLLPYDDDDDTYCKELNVNADERYFDDIKTYAYNKLNDEERTFYSKLDTNEKINLINYERDIDSINCTNVPLRFRILQNRFDEKVTAIILRKLDLINNMDPSSSERVKYLNWIESTCKIPIGKHKQLPVDARSKPEDIHKFISHTSEYFEKNIYGHAEAKEHIIRILAQWISNPASKGNVIGIHGNPGVGKTTLVKECLCKAMDIPFQFIPIGGASDASYLEGHSFTYEGSTWGRIVDALMKAECMNPVLYFDELDKVSDTHRGQEIINLLIHITDPSQNDTFYDKYFADFPIDLSKCLIIFTYNNDNLINPILKDRLIRIHTNDYNTADKINIAQKFIIPELCNQFNIQNDDVIFNDDVVDYIIHRSDVEAGVRNLKRSIELIISNINLCMIIKDKNYNGPIGTCFPFNKSTQSILPVQITNKIVDTYIKQSNHCNESLRHMYI